MMNAKDLKVSVDVPVSINIAEIFEMDKNMTALTIDAAYKVLEDNFSVGPEGHYGFRDFFLEAIESLQYAPGYDTSKVLEEFKKTPLEDLECFMECVPRNANVAVNAYTHDNCPENYVVLNVPITFNLTAFREACEQKEESKDVISPKRAAELLKYCIDYECNGENTSEAIKKLFMIGFTDEEIESFGFCKEDIEYAANDEEPELD